MPIFDADLYQDQQHPGTAMKAAAPLAMMNHTNPTVILAVETWMDNRTKGLRACSPRVRLRIRPNIAKKVCHAAAFATRNSLRPGQPVSVRPHLHNLVRHPLKVPLLEANIPHVDVIMAVGIKASRHQNEIRREVEKGRHDLVSPCSPPSGSIPANPQSHIDDSWAVQGSWFRSILGRSKFRIWILCCIDGWSARRNVSIGIRVGWACKCSIVA